MTDHRQDSPSDGASNGTSDARLSELISDAVSGIEPGDGLTAIRSRTLKETTMSTNSSGRSRTYAVGGAIAGVAAVAAMIVVVSQVNDGDGSTPAANPGSSQSSEPSDSNSPSDAANTPSDDPSTDATTVPTEGAVPVYYAGESGRGVRLFREFQPGSGGDPVAQAASAAVAGPPLDPDYRSLWPEGTEATASYDGDVITVDLTGSALHDLPSGMSEEEAGLAIQQVVYSVQGAAHKRAGVQFLLDGGHTDQVLGEPASEPLANTPALDTLSLMNITAPEEGMVVSGDSLKAEGVNNGFEATMNYEVRQGDEVVASGFATADGWMEDRLFSWKTTVDVSELEPGTYTFVAMNPDPSDGEGFPPDSDSKTFVVR